MEKPKNLYAWPMDMNKGVGVLGGWGVKGEKLGNCNSIINEIIKKKKRNPHMLQPFQAPCLCQPSSSLSTSASLHSLYQSCRVRELLKPCEGGGKPWAETQARLPSHLHLSGPTQACAYWMWQATPRSLQGFQATSERPTSVKNLGFPTLSLSQGFHLELEVGHLSGCCFLLAFFQFSSAIEVFLYFLF